ncbi:MAG: hypothetical protein LBP27_01155, partial [Treponema sp.]|nr:hypothetical protein [Treponema sp.]
MYYYEVSRDFGFAKKYRQIVSRRKDMVSTKKRKYEFNWDETVGADMQIARPHLGPSTRIETYRLFQFTLRDVLEQHYGAETADTLFREAGVLAGRAFFEKFLNHADSVSSLANAIQKSFNDFGIGIFRVEVARP